MNFILTSLADKVDSTHVRRFIDPGDARRFLMGFGHLFFTLRFVFSRFRPIGGPVYLQSDEDIL